MSFYKNKPTFNHSGFSLTVKHGEMAQKVEIPFKKNGTGGKSVGGRQTFLMAIDNFILDTGATNKNELLDYIRNHNLARISTLKNENLRISIDYKGEIPYEGNSDIIYDYSPEMQKFLHTKSVKGVYDFTDPYVVAFQQDILTKLTDPRFSLEYRMFMTKGNPYYNTDLAVAVKSLLQRDIKKFDGVIAATRYYHNLRGHFIAKDKIGDYLEQIERTKITPFNEPQRSEIFPEKDSFQEPAEPIVSSSEEDLRKIPQPKTTIKDIEFYEGMNRVIKGGRKCSQPIPGQTQIIFSYDSGEPQAELNSKAI